MKLIRQILLVSAASVLMAVSGCTKSQQRQPNATQDSDTGTSASAQTLKCSGTITDAAGQPVPGATVEYWGYAQNLFQSDAELKQQVTTGANGAFEFQVSRAAGVLLAHKAGLAPVWKLMGQPFNQLPDAAQNMTLTPPTVLAGVVVDEADKPVANAKVSATALVDEISAEGGVQRVNYLIGKPARDCFAASTDAGGHFRIESIPTNTTAALEVRSPGKVLRESSPYVGGPMTLPWRAGQEDIKLVVEPAGSVEGKIVVEGNSQPVPVARLTLQSDAPGFLGRGGNEPVQSGADGAFLISDVAAGSYHLRAVFGTNSLSDWVAETVSVSAESGKTTHDVQVTAMRGGVLEAVVINESNRKPLPQANVSAFKNNSQFVALSDGNGLARLRVPAGDYQVIAYRDSMQANQSAVSVEAGATNRIEIAIPAPQKITGVVRARNGRPAAGVTVRMIGGFGPVTADVKTDSNGKFDLEWNPRNMGQNQAPVCILARDEEHNLAAAQDLDEDSGPLDLKLAPGLTLAGQVESNGKPIADATASLLFWTANRGMSLNGLAHSDARGRFEIAAMPPGRRYGIVVSAPGYGQQTFNDIGAADAGRQELDIMELKPANLTLAGQVLDANDKPVAGCNVTLQGEGQPSGNTRTDPEGRFVFAHVCEGSARLFANAGTSFGNVAAEGGDTNVELRLGQNFNSAPGVATHKLKGTVTDPGGKPDAGAQVAVFPTMGGRNWVKTGSNGAFNLTWGLQAFQMQSGGPVLVVRDTVRNLAATMNIEEDASNLDVSLKPALTLAGRVEGDDSAPLAGAQVGVWLRAGNFLDQLNDQLAATDAQGRYEIKCLPPDARYTIFATANGHGRHQQQVESDTETNRVELTPFVLKLADRVVAGQVLNENDKPVAGCNVSLQGEGQPNGNMITDSKGRFHFKVCEGQVRLFANSQGGFAQASALAGDTNIVMTLSAQQRGIIRPAPRRSSLKGSPLPDLAGLEKN